MRVQPKIFLRILSFGLAFSTSLITLAQNSKKESNSRYRQVIILSIEEMKSQSHSNLAAELSIEEFIAFYIETGKERVSKEYGKEIIDTIYRDSTYTYFIHRTILHPIDFFKVKTYDLRGINFWELDGQFIRRKFLDEIVPSEDKAKSKRKSQGCILGSEYQDFQYLYDRKTGLLRIVCKWKVSCDFLRVMNKTYQAYYQIDSKTFRN